MRRLDATFAVAGEGKEQFAQPGAPAACRAESGQRRGGMPCPPPFLFLRRVGRLFFVLFCWFYWKPQANQSRVKGFFVFSIEVGLILNPTYCKYQPQNDGNQANSEGFLLGCALGSFSFILGCLRVAWGFLGAILPPVKPEEKVAHSVAGMRAICQVQCSVLKWFICFVARFPHH